MSVRRFSFVLLCVLFAASSYVYFSWGLPVPFRVTLIEALDRNHDGAIDTWCLDTTGNRESDLTEIDSDADGRVDLLRNTNSAGQVANTVVPTQKPRRRLAVCLDGVPFEDMAQLWDEGYFREFSRPAKLVSSFPSLSDIALTELLHTEQVPGYENLYFDLHENRIRGGATSTVSKVRLPYLDALDYDEPGAFKGLAYVIPIRTFHADLGRFLKRYATSQNPQYVAHICSTDSICHVLSREEFLKLMVQVDRLLREIYVQALGQLVFVVFSDHGNSHVQNHRIDIDSLLAARGFHVGSSVQDSRSVVIPAFGLVGAMPVYCQTQSVAQLAAAFVEIEGVDFVTYLDREVVQILAARGSARISATEFGKRLRYSPSDGDPLKLNSVVEQMGELGRLDAAGFAFSEDWFNATAEHEYADAVNAIYRGTTNHVVNRASLMVSFKDGYHYGSPFFDRLVTMRSTHGNLHRTSMTGFFMHNGPTTSQILPARELLRDWLQK